MEKITSFTIDHMTLLPGVYVSRGDSISKSDVFTEIGAQPIPHDSIPESELFPITTYDIRMTRPNFEPVMSTGEIHAIEHLGATYLRNREDLKYHIIYWGPMGCRTGFYLIMAGDIPVETIVKLMQETYTFIADFEGEIPGAKPEECGNYSDMDLAGAKARARAYLEVLKTL